MSVGTLGGTSPFKTALDSVLPTGAYLIVRKLAADQLAKGRCEGKLGPILTGAALIFCFVVHGAGVPA